MFNLFRKKQGISRPFSGVGIDMHSHLIPGIDDGAATVQDSVAMIAELKAMGYEKIITTPHTYQDYYPNTTKDILDGLEKVRQELHKEGIDIEIDAASEYYMDENFEQRLADKDLLTLGDTDYVLVEMSFFGPPPALDNYIFDMEVAGFKPVLAHPERYGFYAKDFQQYERLVNLGCSLQINALSLIGHYGSLAQKTAEKLLKKEMVSFIGTDCHNLKHIHKLQLLGASTKWMKYLDYPFKNLAL